MTGGNYADYGIVALQSLPEPSSLILAALGLIGVGGHRLRRRLTTSRRGETSRNSYLLLVNYTGRLFRDGKALTSADQTGILERLGSTVLRWQARLDKLKGGRLLSRYFASTRVRLGGVAARIKVHHLANLGGYPTV